MMIPSRPTCVSWLLLASYAVLLGVGGVGVWVSVNNFWEEDPLPPVPPPELESTSDTTTTTTTSYPYRNNYYSRNEMKVPEAYREYVYESHYFATATSDSRMYVLLPCVVCVVVAALVLVVGLWSRQLFSSTFSLYNSLGMWVLTLTWAILYQSVVGGSKYVNLDPICWVLAFHIVLMLLLSVQIVLCVWELRRQEAGWPTINYRSVFTAEALLVTARVALTVYTFISLSWSELYRGLRGQEDPRYDIGTVPYIRYPLVFTFVCYSAACYNAVATIETVLSMLLGKLHICMTTVTSLLSALCCVTVAVLNSPVVMKVISTSDYIQPETMYFAIGLSVVTFLHFIACLSFSTSSRSPPDIINKISNLLMSSISSLGNGMVTERLLHSPLLPENGKGYRTFNLISAVFSAISIIIIGAVWYSPLYRAWGSVIVLCANSATLVRTLPAFAMEYVFKETENTSVNQRLMAMSLECPALFVGTIGIFANCYGPGEIFAGVVNFMFLIFQVFIMLLLLKEKIKAKQSGEAENLTATEEVSSEGQDNEQNPNDLLA